MPKTKKPKEFNPWQSYFMIGGGVLLIIVRFLEDISTWSTVDLVKVAVGIALIGYGTFKLIKKK